MFSMHVYSLFRFVLIKLPHRGKPGACIFKQLNESVLNLALCLVVYTLLCVLLYQ